VVTNPAKISYVRVTTPSTPSHQQFRPILLRPLRAQRLCARLFCSRKRSQPANPHKCDHPNPRIFNQFQTPLQQPLSFDTVTNAPIYFSPDVILAHTRNAATPFLSYVYFTVLCRPRGRGYLRLFLCELRALCVKTHPQPCPVQSFNHLFSTFKPSYVQRNFYPPHPDLLHNPAAQGHHPQPSPRAGRIQ
jgi:hypothetical protein